MNRIRLACRGVDVRRGERTLVRGLDLDVAAGERWVVVGPNGAGKSSLLLVLVGARAPERGRIELEGRPIGAWSVEELAALRAMVADRWVDPFAMSVLETVEAARYRLRLRAGWRQRGAPGGTDVAARAERLARECLQAMDCGTLAARDIRGLSRGERQRVAVAAALAQESALMLLDEPVSHQDPRHQVLVLESLKARASATYVGALHDMNAAARFATHALLLAGDGRWQAGPAAEVLSCERLSELFGTEIVQLGVGDRSVFVTTGGPSPPALSRCAGEGSLLT